MRGFVPIFFIFTSLLWARSYPVDGLILEVRGDTMVVAHRPIPNFMPAMTMPVRVLDRRQLQGIAPGMRVRFELDRAGARKLRRVLPDEGDFPLATPAASLGSIIPDFTLTDQSGRRVSLSDWRGKLLAIQFIYTRCPMPEVCPRLAASFATVHRKFGPRVMLLSLTIDPVHDTPAVLAVYAKQWGAREGWSFLTGSPAEITQAASPFGVIYWPEDGAITHTSRVAIISREGRLLAMVEGSAFRADQLIQLIQHHLE